MRTRQKEGIHKAGWTIKDSHEAELPAFGTIEVENKFFSMSHYL